MFPRDFFPGPPGLEQTQDHLIDGVASKVTEEEEDGPRGLSPALRGLAFQVWPEGLQQARVQLLGLIKNEQGLVAALLRPPHLVRQLLLHRARGAAGEPWGGACPQGSAGGGQGLGSALELPNSNRGRWGATRAAASNQRPR